MSAIKAISLSILLAVSMAACKEDKPVQQSAQVEEEPVLSYEQQLEQRIQTEMNHVRRSCASNTTTETLSCYNRAVQHYTKLTTNIRDNTYTTYHKKSPKDWWETFAKHSMDKNYGYNVCRFQRDPTKVMSLLECQLKEFFWIDRHVAELHAGLWSQPTGVAGQQSADYLRSIPESNSEQYEGD